MQFSSSALVDEGAIQRDLRLRAVLFAAWLLLVAWLMAGHVIWRDEARAFSLALSGSGLAEMLRNVHGEGHPALWYLILRGAHELFPFREVLPAVGAAIGIAAMAVFTFRSPFRLVVVALVLFSAYATFDFLVVSRNYGISALVMFSLAALYPRIRNSLWFGVMLLVLCNTNVPSCLLAAALLLFRFLELLTGDDKPSRRDWAIFAGNAALAPLGAWLAFITVYPTFNDAAVSSRSEDLSPGNILAGLLHPDSGFWNLGFGPILPALGCLALVRRPAAFAAAVSGFVAMKLFFYFVYLSYYRHEALFVVFLLTLLWISERSSAPRSDRRWVQIVEQVGAAIFIVLLALQFARLVSMPINQRLRGIPYSRSADVAQLLRRPELKGAIVMGDPDTMVESLRYYTDNRLWMLRQQRFGDVVRLSTNSRWQLSPDDILADAKRLHDRTGRPIVILTVPEFKRGRPISEGVMFADRTIGTAQSVDRFLASTRRIARLRPSSDTEENYDVYVYPASLRPSEGSDYRRAGTANSTRK